MIFKCVKKKGPRRTYLVTYSQVNKETFPTRESFGQAVTEAFNTGSGKVAVDYWASCLENHASGGEHFHVSIKLTGPKRWISVKNNIIENHGVTVNFSQSHDSYYTAYKYVTKTDLHVYHSANHPNLKNIGSPKTKHCIKAYREKHKQRESSE